MRPKASGALQTVVTLAECDDDDDNYQGFGDDDDYHGCGDDNDDDNCDEKLDSSHRYDDDCKEGRRRKEDAG